MVDLLDDGLLVVLVGQEVEIALRVADDAFDVHNPSFLYFTSAGSAMMPLLPLVIW